MKLKNRINIYCLNDLIIYVFLCATFISCSSIKDFTNENSKLSLKLLYNHEIPLDETFNGTIIGGISGIDYDRKNDVFYLISDDRSIRNYARFYKAKLHINQTKIDSLQFLEVIPLKGRTAEKFKNWKVSPFYATDPEDIRYNTDENYFMWSSEGERLIQKNKAILQNPSVFFMDSKGGYLNELELPDNLKMNLSNKGPRRNGVLEGLTFSADYKSIYTSLEMPLYEDGEPASIDRGALVRIFKFDVKSKKNNAQYAYKLDPVAHQPIPKDGDNINGISAILEAGENKLLIVERSYSKGKASNTIKVFLCDLNHASNIRNTFSLKKEKGSYEVVSKKLLLNMDNIKIPIDNIEGICYGKKRANGNKTVWFVSDNNFSKRQKTQVLVFEWLKSSQKQSNSY